MRLIIKRGQKTSGMRGKTITFQLLAKVELDAAEQAALAKYNFGNETIYARENIAAAAPGTENTWGGIARNLTAAAANLRVSVNCLVHGRVIECKSISEILDVEHSIHQACNVLKSMLIACEGFEGQTVTEF